MINDVRFHIILGINPIINKLAVKIQLHLTEVTDASFVTSCAEYGENFEDLCRDY